MAHVGKAFPIKQEWRLYSGDAASLAGFPPRAIWMRSQTWICSFPKPPENVFFGAEPQDWEIGDRHVRYLSSALTSGAHVIKVGLDGWIDDNGQMRWTWIVEDNGVDQIPAGWHSVPFDYPFGPGFVEIWPTDSGFPGSIQPVGVVEVKAKVWADF